MGAEIAEQVPDAEVVLVPLCGGGLISGVAAALAPRGVRVVGVEPELAADAAESLRRGRLVVWSAQAVARTAADALRVRRLGTLPWAHVRQLVDRIVTVTEDEITEAAQMLAVHARVVAEPAGAVSTAAWLRHRDELPAGRTVAIVSGGNADPLWLSTVLVTEGLATGGRLEP